MAAPLRREQAGRYYYSTGLLAITYGHKPHSGKQQRQPHEAGSLQLEPPRPARQPSGLAPSPRLFNHLVGTDEQYFRERQTERLGGLGVDDKLNLHGSLHRQIGGLFALEDAAGVDADLAK